MKRRRLEPSGETPPWPLRWCSTCGRGISGLAAAFAAYTRSGNWSSERLLARFCSVDCCKEFPAVAQQQSTEAAATSPCDKRDEEDRSDEDDDEDPEDLEE